MPSCRTFAKDLSVGWLVVVLIRKKTLRGDRQQQRAARGDGNQIEEPEESSGEDSLWLVDEVRTIHSVPQPPIKVPVCIDGVDVCMELDTGASVSLISETHYKQLWPRRSLDTSSIRMQTYSKEPRIVLGTFDVLIVCEGQQETLPLVVVKGNVPTLFGRNWLNKFKLNCADIHYMQAPVLNKMLTIYSALVKPGLGTFQGPEVSCVVDPDATPRFNKARPIPYALRTQVADELDRLVKEGTLKPVDYAEWAASIVAVLKSDSQSVRICGDFRMTINPVSKLNRYPSLKVEDLLSYPLCMLALHCGGTVLWYPRCSADMC